MAIYDNITDVFNAMWPLFADRLQNTLIQTGSGAITSPPATAGAPAGAQYLTLANDAALTSERVFALDANSGLVGVDAGANNSYYLSLGAPTALTVSTTNSVFGTSHTHAITSSSNPGASASILASDASGFLTLPQFTATTKVRTPLIDTTAGALTLQPAADLLLSPVSNLVKLASGKYFQSDNYASQSTGMRISHSGEGDFRYLFADELHAKSFIADLEQALAGGQVIAKSVAMLYANFTMPAAGSSSTFVVRDLPSATGMRVFEDRDIVRFRSFSRSAGSLSITDAWGEATLDTTYGVSGFDSATKTQRYTYLRRQSVTIDDQSNDPITDQSSDLILSSNISIPEGSMSGGTAIAADAVVLDYGKNTSGIHEINAIDGAYGLNSPYSQTVSWHVHPKNAVVRTRLGNLNGIFGVAGEYGLYAGSGTSSSDQYIRASSAGVMLNNVPLSLYSNGLQRVNIDASGTNVWFSPDGGTTKRLAWDGSVLSLNDASLDMTGTGRITLAGAGTVTMASAGIYGIDATGKPTFSLVNATTTVNGEAMTSGDTMLGNNTAGVGNTFFDQSAGTLNIRNGTTNVLSFGSTSAIEGVLNLGASGGIWQGSSGSFSSPGTGLRVYNTSSLGMLELWYGGAGILSLRPDNGLTILGGTGYVSRQSVNFIDSSGTRLGEVYGYSDGSTYNAVRLQGYSNSTSRAAAAFIQAAQEANGLAQIYIWASKFTSPSTLGQPNAYIYLESDQPNNQAVIQLQVRSTSATSTFTLDQTGATLTNGIKAFKIDHPLAPAEKWLYHNSVEGPGHYTFYRGNVTLDDTGRAIVEMPDWFDALNDDVSIVYGSWGDASPARTLRRIQNGWEIAGEPRARVSWMASGERRDAWARAHPLAVETIKKDADAGYVAAWREYGMSEMHAKPMPAQ